MPLYAASKDGINQLVRTLAVDGAEYGIRVNAVAPDYIDNIMDGGRSIATRSLMTESEASLEVIWIDRSIIEQQVLDDE